MSVPRDVQEFLEGYPDVGNDPKAKANLLFYTNRGHCKPDNLLIDDLHQKYASIHCTAHDQWV